MNIFKSIIWNFHPYQHLKKYFGDDIGFSLIYSLASSGVQACVQIASFCVITRLRQELSALSRDKLDCLIPGLAEFTTNLIQTCEKFLCILSLYVWHIFVWMREWLWKQYCTKTWQKSRWTGLLVLQEVESESLTTSDHSILSSFYIIILKGGTFMLIPGAKLVCLNRCRM